MKTKTLEAGMLNVACRLQNTTSKACRRILRTEGGELNDKTDLHIFTLYVVCTDNG